MTLKEKRVLASFVNSSMYSILISFLEENIKNIRECKIKRNNEFETIYQLGKTDGEIAGCDSIIKRLEVIYRKYGGKI